MLMLCVIWYDRNGKGLINRNVELAVKTNGETEKNEMRRKEEEHEES